MIVKAEEGMRKCGSCSACCTAARPEGEGSTPCICPRHAASLEKFECLWLRGAVRSADKPERCGIVFGEMPDPEFREVVTAKEVWEGAASCSIGKRAIGLVRNRRGMPVVLYDTAGGKTVVLPDVGRLLDPLEDRLHRVGAAAADRRNKGEGEYR